MTATASGEDGIDFLGQGEFPAELDRPNWGAAIFVVIWVFLYAVKRWRAWLVSLIVVPLLVENVVLLFIGADRPLTIARQVLDPLTLATFWVIQIAFGLNANRIIWRQQQARFDSAGSDPRRPIPMWRFRKSIRFWTRLGLALVVLGVTINVVLLAVHRESLAVAITSLPFSIVPLAVIASIDGVRRSRVPAS
jgi:hypothetical protein